MIYFSQLFYITKVNSKNKMKKCDVKWEEFVTGYERTGEKPQNMEVV